MNSNKNKVAIVTGGAKNIGRATCIELAKLNFNILIHANTLPHIIIMYESFYVALVYH